MEGGLGGFGGLGRFWVGIGCRILGSFFDGWLGPWLPSLFALPLLPLVELLPPLALELATYKNRENQINHIKGTKPLFSCGRSYLPSSRRALNHPAPRAASSLHWASIPFLL